MSCSCSISGSWKNIVIIWCCSIMVWISQLYFIIICFMILITFLFVGLYHKLNKPAVGCRHNILWISKRLLQTNNELKQAHQKIKVSFFSSWSKFAPDWTYAPNESGSIHHHHPHHHHHDWLAEENSLVRCLYWKARYFRGAQQQFLENICSEDDLRSRLFVTFVVKFLACLPLLGFSNI